MKIVLVKNILLKLFSHKNKIFFNKKFYPKKCPPVRLFLLSTNIKLNGCNVKLVQTFVISLNRIKGGEELTNFLLLFNKTKLTCVVSP